jgi:hypothetical protein
MTRVRFAHGDGGAKDVVIDAVVNCSNAHCNVDLDEPVEASAIHTAEEEVFVIESACMHHLLTIISFALSSPDPEESLDPYPPKCP